jgi:hypothetical protein
MKTKVEITQNVHQCIFKQGDIGYIDGYCRAGDDRAYAVVVVGDRLDFVPIFSLRVIS